MVKLMDFQNIHVEPIIILYNILEIQYKNIALKIINTTKSLSYIIHEFSILIYIYIHDIHDLFLFTFLIFGSSNEIASSGWNSVIGSSIFY